MPASMPVAARSDAADDARARTALARFAALSAERVRRLIYGELETAEDLSELEVLATAAGVHPAELVSASGEIDEDPRTGPGNPHAVYHPATSTERDADPAPAREARSGLTPAGQDQPVDPIDGEESAGDARPPLPRPATRPSLYTAAAAATSDLIEAWLRGGSELAAWVRKILDRRDLLLPALPLHSPTAAAVA